MKYFSTRGGLERLSFEETVLTGLAPNGGLFIPISIPTLPSDWSTTWSTLPFPQLAHQILSLFISPSEIPSSDLLSLIEKSYSSFRHPDVAPLRQIGEDDYVLELWHGPTWAFKDVALQFLGNLFEYFLERRNRGRKDEDRQRLTVVGATSGDTGSAAIYGLRGKSDVSIFILHPHGRVSPIQEAQMTSVLSPNVFNLSLTGTFDDCQDIVKTLFSDAPFNARYKLGAINSINWARILAQITYYFSSYFLLLNKLGLSVEEAQSKGLRVRYVVPTGNFGDILAGWYAKRLGLPMEQLVVATNENDILTRFFNTGRYEKSDSSLPSATDEAQVTDQTAPVNGSTDGGQPASAAGGVKETLSPAMDILVSSNFERLLWYLAFESSPNYHAVADYDAGDVDGGLAKRMEVAGAQVREWMERLKKEGSFDVGEEVRERARREFAAERVDDEQTTETIRRHYSQSDQFGSYIVDPHTAVGLEASRRVRLSSSSTSPLQSIIQITLSTAHPAKFASAVSSALPPEVDFDRDVLPEEFRGLLERERRSIRVEGVEPERTREVVRREYRKLWGNDGVEPREVAEAKPSV